MAPRQAAPARLGILQFVIVTLVVGGPVSRDHEPARGSAAGPTGPPASELADRPPPNQSAWPGPARGSPESVDTLIELILLCPASASCHVTAGAQVLSRWSPRRAAGPERNDLDWAEHRRILEAG